jgi:hypothetical protein
VAFHELTNSKLKALLKKSEGDRAKEADRLEKIRSYVLGDHPGPYRPKTANAEYNLLIERSITNLLPMVRNASAQQLFIEGYRTSPKAGGVPSTAANATGWTYWQANQFDSRQSQIFTSSLTYGYAWGTALPGTRGPVMRGVSARKMFCLWEDPVDDEFPQYALSTKPGTGEVTAVLDSQFRYKVGRTSGDFGPQIVGQERHGVGVCPVVRYAPDIDLDGRCTGEIEPLYAVQDRINQTSFDLLIAQTYGSFKIRGISGLAAPVDPSTGQPVPITFDVRRFLFAEDADVKPWQLDGTPLDGYIAAFDLAVHHLAVKSQTPPHYLLGKMANLSADALAAAETTLTRKVAGYKHTLGEAAEQHIRLASAVAKDPPTEQDVHAQVVWADMESRSLSQVADALGKMKDSLEIPAVGLWTKLPGVTQADIDQWKALRAAEDPIQAMRAELDRQAGDIATQRATSRNGGVSVNGSAVA